MWDSWEAKFGGKRHDNASLRGFRRSFNKASTRNWGSRSQPCPTLGLEPDPNGTCQGTAFEFSQSKRQEVLEFLQAREGASFSLDPLPVQLISGVVVEAATPLNDRTARSYLGDKTLPERVSQAIAASGSNGSCIQYVSNLRTRLHELNISDPAVEEFHAAIRDASHGCSQTVASFLKPKRPPSNSG